MIYVYGALLLHKAGKEINEGSLRKVVEGTGIKADDGKIKALVAALHGVNIEEVIKNALATQVAVQAAPVQGQAEKKEAKPEKSEGDKKKEEEQASAGLSSLFG
jgi:large subunit ribosomal protein L12